MADFSVPFVNQVANAKDDQDQKTAMSQMMQVAQLAMYQQRQKDQEQDKEFNGLIKVFGSSAMPVQARIESGERLMGLMGVKGYHLTEAGIVPMAERLTSMAERLKKGEDISDEGTALDMILKDPNLVRVDQRDTLATVVDAYKGQMARSAVDVAVPARQPVIEAQEHITGRAEELADLTQQEEKLRATVNGLGGIATVSGTQKADAQQRLDRLRTLQDDEMHDQAVVNQDVHRKESNARLARMVKHNPELVEKIRLKGYQALGVALTDEHYVKDHWYGLSQIPENERTPEQVRALDVDTIFLGGKSNKANAMAVTVGLLTERQRQMKVEGQRIGEVRDSDGQAQERADAHRTTITAISEGVKDPNQTPEQWDRHGAETRGFSAMLGEEQRAVLEANQPKVATILTDVERLREDVDTMRQRLPVTPMSGRDEIKTQMRLKQDQLTARESQAALLTTHMPLVAVDLEFQATMQRQEADHIKAALGNQSLTAEEKKRLEDEFSTADRLATKATDDLKTWTGERNKHLAALTQVQTHFEDESRILREKMTSTEHAMEKDAQTSGLLRAIVTDMADAKAHGKPLTYTQAYRQNQKDYPGADVKEVGADVTTFFKVDQEKALHQAQMIFSGLVSDISGHEPTPQELQKAASTAAKQTEKDTGELVSIDGIMKAYEKTTNTTIIKSPESSRKDALETHAAVKEGVHMIDGMIDGITKNPSAVGTAGNIKQWIAGVSQQFTAMTVDIDKNGQSLKKLKSYSSKPTDDLESAQNALIYMVARALSPVGVISDQDAARAEQTVGNIKDWGRGYEQAINKLTFVRGFLLGKDEMAEQVYHNQDPWAAAPPPKGTPAETPAGQPKTADDFFKKHPKLLQGAVH